MNDEINKLIREKGHWERRILQLGGPDYAKTAPKVTDSQGNVVSDSRGVGYRYFGAAKNLPGVRELFELEPPKKIRRTRHEMYRKINGDYYGFRDEEDGVLLTIEADAEKQLREQVPMVHNCSIVHFLIVDKSLSLFLARCSADSTQHDICRTLKYHLLDKLNVFNQALIEWEKQEEERIIALEGVKTAEETVCNNDVEDEPPQFVAYVPLPDDKEIEQRVLNKKKADLMSKYASEQMLKQQEDAKALLRKK